MCTWQARHNFTSIHHRNRIRPLLGRAVLPQNEQNIAIKEQINKRTHQNQTTTRLIWIIPYMEIKLNMKNIEFVSKNIGLSKIQFFYRQTAFSKKTFNFLRKSQVYPSIWCPFTVGRARNLYVVSFCLLRVRAGGGSPPGRCRHSLGLHELPYMEIKSNNKQHKMP